MQIVKCYVNHSNAASQWKACLRPWACSSSCSDSLGPGVTPRILPLVAGTLKWLIAFDFQGYSSNFPTIPIFYL